MFEKGIFFEQDRAPATVSHKEAVREKVVVEVCEPSSPRLLQPDTFENRVLIEDWQHDWLQFQVASKYCQTPP